MPALTFYLQMKQKLEKKKKKTMQHMKRQFKSELERIQEWGDRTQERIRNKRKQ